jgi:hypothetical protein
MWPRPDQQSKQQVDKKDDAAPLATMNVLSGKFEQPKVVLSWKRNSFRAQEKAGDASAADLFKERTEIEHLQAAINLMLEEQISYPTRSTSSHYN